MTIDSLGKVNAKAAANLPARQLTLLSFTEPSSKPQSCHQAIKLIIYGFIDFLLNCCGDSQQRCRTFNKHRVTILGLSVGNLRHSRLKSWTRI